MLNRHECRVVLVANDRATRLCLARHREELLDVAAHVSLEGHTEQAVVVTDPARGAVGRNPEVADRVEREVIRAGDRRDRLRVDIAVEGLVATVRVAGHEEEVPRELGARLVTLLVELEDLTVAVLLARVDFIHLEDLALRVVREGRVHLARVVRRLDVLGAVHLGGLHLVGSGAGVDRDLFDSHALNLRLAVEDQRDPFAGAVELTVRRNGAAAVDFFLGRVAVEARDVEIALGEERHVVLAIALDVLLLGDELVHVLEALVVTRVHDRVTVLGDDNVRTLVLEAADRGVLLRGRGGVPRVNLDSVTEAVDLVFVAGVRRIEARVNQFEAVHRLFRVDAEAGVRLNVLIGNEVAVEVFFARKERAPRGEATRAVREGAEDRASLGVVLRLHEVGARGGAGEFILRVEEEAAVEFRTLHVGVGRLAVLALELHDGEALGCHGDGDLIMLRHVLREHDVRVRVLVVHEHDGAQAIRAGDLLDLRVVVVVPKLLRLGFGSLVVPVELRRVVKEGVAPLDDGCPAVALGHVELVDILVDGGDRGEAELRAVRRFGRRADRGVRGARVGSEGGLTHALRTAGGDHEGACGSTAEERAAADRSGDDVTDVGVVARIACGLRALVVALECTGHCGTLAANVILHEEREVEHHWRHPFNVVGDLTQLQCSTRGTNIHSKSDAHVNFFSKNSQDVRVPPATRADEAPAYTLTKKTQAGGEKAPGRAAAPCAGSHRAPQQARERAPRAPSQCAGAA